MAIVTAEPYTDDTVGITYVEPGTATTHAEVLPLATGDTEYVYTDGMSPEADYYALDYDGLWAFLSGVGTTLDKVVLGIRGMVDDDQHGEQYRGILQVMTFDYFTAAYNDLAWTSHYTEWTNNPNGGAWDPADIYDILIGCEVTGDPTDTPASIAAVSLLTLDLYYTTADGSPHRATILL